MSSKVVILGARESGLGAALLAKAKGYNTFVSDYGSILPAYKAELEAAGIKWEEKQHSLDEIMEAQLVVKSPGIPEKAPIIGLIRKAGISLISEIEFATRYVEGKMIAITGSNGKTTTTDLCGEIMKAAELNAMVGGNIGTALSRQVAAGGAENYVVELSSFQLDDIIDFKPQVAVLLNVTPDHLDRYNYSLNEYGEAKFNIVRNQKAEDHFVYCSDDPWTNMRVQKAELNSKNYAFGLNYSADKAAWLDREKGCICFRFEGGGKAFDFSVATEQMQLKGEHNFYNAMAAGISCLLLGANENAVQTTLEQYRAPQHRMEELQEVNEVLFINDSKATNIVSVHYALKAMTRPIVWIVGGTDKGNDYSQLEAEVMQKVSAIVCLGIDNSKLMGAFADKKSCVETKDMNEAVKIAADLAKPGDVVLLSPACASFDLFQNYEDRGRKFKEAVERLSEKNNAA